MALEGATYVNGLVATNPTGSDPISQGDDHLKLIKDVLKKTFPGSDQGVNTIHASATAPSSIVADGSEVGTRGMIWYDTSNNLLKVNTSSSGTAAWTALPISTSVAHKIMGSATIGWVLPTTDGAANQLLKTDGSGNLDWVGAASVGLPSQSGNSGKFLTTDGADASWGTVSTLNVQKITHYSGDAATNIRSTSMTTAVTFSVVKDSATTDLLIQAEIYSGMYNYGTDQSGSFQIYNNTSGAIIGSAVSSVKWNNLGASALVNNEVGGWNTITVLESSPLAAATYDMKIQGTCANIADGGNSTSRYSIVVWEIAA